MKNTNNKRRSPKHYESSSDCEEEKTQNSISFEKESEDSVKKSEEEYLEKYEEEKKSKSPKVTQTFEHYYKMKGMASLFNIYTDAVIKLEYDYNLYISKLKKITDKIDNLSFDKTDDKNKKYKKLHLKKSDLEKGLKTIKKRMQKILLTVSKSLSNAAISLE